MSEKTIVTKDWKIGDIRALGPEANEVMDSIFGPGCFGCPNSKTKTVEFGSTIHGKDPDKVVEKLNQVLSKDN